MRSNVKILVSLVTVLALVGSAVVIGMTYDNDDS